MELVWEALCSKAVDMDYSCLNCNLVHSLNRTELLPMLAVDNGNYLAHWGHKRNMDSCNYSMYAGEDSFDLDMECYDKRFAGCSVVERRDLDRLEASGMPMCRQVDHSAIAELQEQYLSL